MTVQNLFVLFFYLSVLLLTSSGPPGSKDADLLLACNGESEDGD